MLTIVVTPDDYARNALARYGSSAKEIAALRVMKQHTEKGHSAGE
jgi:hypothetical protein